MVEVKRVSGAKAAQDAVEGVSFKLPNGKIYGIYDSTHGCASLLTALMAGAVTPSEGEVLINGFSMQKEAKKAKKCIGYLPFDLCPDDEMTVMEYLLFVADAKGLQFERTVRYLHELLEMTDLSDKKDRLIANLSFGEVRTVGILQSLLGDPEILILDSPCAGTKPRDAQRLRALIRHVAQNKTVFLCERSQADLKELCHEIILLSNGRFVSVESPDSPALQDTANADKNEHAEADTKKSKDNRWKMLMQSGEEEWIDENEKEDNRS